MLLFIDEPRHVRIVRQGDAGGSREPIGRLRKHEALIPDEIRAELRGDEYAEVEAAIALLREGDRARVKAAIAELPAMLREVTDYFKAYASPTERRWIVGALWESLRLVRRHDRETQERENPQPEAHLPESGDPEAPASKPRAPAKQP